MKKGFNSIEFLIGMLCSFLVISIISSGLNILKKVSYDSYNEDMLAAVQLYQVFNLAYDVDVLDDEINFSYLNEERKLSLKNNKVILSPGTVIYYLYVDHLKFYVDNDNFIIMEISRLTEQSKYLIGQI